MLLLQEIKSIIKFRSGIWDSESLHNSRIYGVPFIYSCGIILLNFPYKFPELEQIGMQQIMLKYPRQHASLWEIPLQLFYYCPLTFLLKVAGFISMALFCCLGVCSLYSQVVSSPLVEKGTQSNYGSVWQYSKLNNAEML